MSTTQKLEASRWTVSESPSSVGFALRVPGRSRGYGGEPRACLPVGSCDTINMPGLRPGSRLFQAVAGCCWPGCRRPGRVRRDRVAVCVSGKLLIASGGGGRPLSSLRHRRLSDIAGGNYFHRPSNGIPITARCGMFLFGIDSVARFSAWPPWFCPGRNDHDCGGGNGPNARDCSGSAQLSIVANDGKALLL